MSERADVSTETHRLGAVVYLDRTMGCACAVEAAGTVDALPESSQAGNAPTSSLETTERFPQLPQPPSFFRSRFFGTTGPR